jgi:hypothetical protein
MGNPTAFSGRNGYSLYFNVTQHLEPENNRSRFDWSLYIYATNVSFKPYSFNTSTITASIGGTAVVNGTFTYDYRSAVVNTVVTNFGSGSHYIGHDTSGYLGAQSWTSTATAAGSLGSATADGSGSAQDFVRTPSAVSVASLTRSANGQDISLSSTGSTFYGSGGYYAWRWSYDNASWSAGIGMSGTNGSGSGFDSAATIFVQVIAVDSEGNSGWSGSASVAGISAPSWSTATALSNATRGTSYSATVIASPSTGYSLFSQSGGTGTYTVTNNGSSATISGTPTATGTASVTVRAANYDRTTDRTFTFTVRPALPVFSDGSVNSSARVGVAYSDGVAASEAASYSVFSGALPGGLTLNTSTGAITGTPTTPGTFTFVLRATNVTGSTNTGTLTITVISSARVWNGSAFVVAQARVWNGSSFVTGTIRVWDGSAWVNTK